MRNYTFEEAENYLNEIPKFAGKHTLADTAAFLDALGAPDRGMKIIHVAGTNGKGSTCCYLASILRQAGYRVGVFTSPHLVCVRERMECDGRMISEEEFLRAFLRVLSLCPELGHPSYFEFLFLMGMCWYADQAPDYLILETGLGGRLDATNSVRNKEISVITRIGLDHMKYLGNTVEDIAGEKAGIIAAGVPVVCFGEPEGAFEVIAGRAAEQNSPLVRVTREDFEAVPGPGRSIDFSFLSRYDYLNGNIENGIRALLATDALYQGENSALAVSCVLRMRSDGKVSVTEEAIARGLEKARWPGRMEEILPGVIADGAHNPDGIRAFLESVASRGRADNLLLFGAVSDKDTSEMMAQIRQSGRFRKIFAVQLRTERSLDCAGLSKLAGADNVWPDTRSGLENILRERRAGETVYAAGSLYMVGELKALVKEFL